MYDFKKEVLLSQLLIIDVSFKNKIYFAIHITTLIKDLHKYHNSCTYINTTVSLCEKQDM